MHTFHRFLLQLFSLVCIILLLNHLAILYTRFTNIFNHPLVASQIKPEIDPLSPLERQPSYIFICYIWGFFPILHIMSNNKLGDQSFQKYQVNELSYYKTSSIYHICTLCPIKMMSVFKNMHSVYWIPSLRMKYQ